ncbi:MAG: sigma-54-dependent transcriptional regulator [Chthoniobacteraceae bacterium]
MNFEKILIVDDEPSGRRVLEAFLRSQQYSVATAGTLAEADRLLKQEFFDLLLVDLDLPDGSGSDLLARTAGMELPPIALVLSGNSTGEAVIRCLRAGAFDYLGKPYSLDALRAAMERAAAFRHGLQVRRYLEGELCCEREMVGDSPGIRHLRSLVAHMGAGNDPILISGERGTGKCRVAGMVHRASTRADGPLVRVNCAGAEEAALDNELFGRITETCDDGGCRRVLKGGRLELAQGGTLLLDEVSELPMCVQVKLLDALKTGQWVRLGGERRLELDIRVVATTQRDLAGCVARGGFLPELHQYLSRSILHVPPLRERIADLPAMVYDWLERSTSGGKPCGISEEALRHLMAYSWPGNVRELENVLDRAVMLTDGGTRLEAESFQWLDTKRIGALPQRNGESSATAMGSEPLLTLEEMEKRQVIRALEITNQNRTRAAGLLKISVRTLRNKLHQYRAEDPTLVLTLARNRNLPLVAPVVAVKPQPPLGVRI